MSSKLRLGLVVVLVASIAVSYYLLKRHKGPTSNREAVTTSRVRTTAIQGPTTNNVGSQNSVSPVGGNGLNAVTPPPYRDKGEVMKRGLATLNDQEIVFFGKVIDQSGAPVPEVEVTGIITVANGTREGTDEVFTTTDGEGRFTIEGKKGARLSIKIIKEGFVSATVPQTYFYSLLWSEAERYRPDKSNPTLMRMWKLRGAETLVGINQKQKFHFTNAPIIFDLMAGKIVPTGGDIKITLSRASGIVSEQSQQDWSVSIDAVDGGLIDTTVAEGRVTFELPKDGYLPSITYEMSTNAHGWRGAFSRELFLQSRGGQIYSKLNFGIAINRQPGDLVSVEIHGEANTNASRNFEADASQ